MVRNDSLLACIAIASSLLAIYCFWPGLDRLYVFLTAPICGVKRLSVEADLPVFRGVAWLTSVYFFTGVLFAFTGGTLGGFARSEATTALIAPKTGMSWGFTVGILLAGIARIAGATTSCGVARQLSVLAILTVGLGFFVGVLDPAVYTKVSDEYLKASFFEFPSFALLGAVVSTLSVEGIILLREYWGRPGSREVPRSLIRERIEAHDFVEQVFLPGRVVPITSALISDLIATGGLRSLCWMTNTAPEDHLRNLWRSTVEWTGKNGSTDPEDTAKRILAANVRVVVPSPTVRQRVQKSLPSVRRFRVTNGPFRMRLLIVNNTVAVVHLPIPFHGEETEESNLAAICRNIESVQELQCLFDTLWENMYTGYLHEEVNKLLLAANTVSPQVLLLIAQSPAGLTRSELESALDASETRVASAMIADSLEVLRSRKLVWEDGGGRFMAVRRAGFGTSVDTLVRAVQKRFVDLWPTEIS